MGKTRHVIRGRSYSLNECAKLKRPLLGTTSHPAKKHLKIKVHRNLKGRDRLEVLIHEALHAAYWDLDEEAIDEAGIDISKMLWKLGYRRAK